MFLERGNSYLRIGWEWVKGVLHRGWRLFSTLSLCGDIDPSPAMPSAMHFVLIASQKQTKKFLEREFRVRTFSHTW